MDKKHLIEKDSAGWQFFVRTSFVLAMTAVATGVYFLPVDAWTRGFMAIGILYLVGSSFTLAKALRDEHEANRFINQVREAKNERLLSEFEMKN